MQIYEIFSVLQSEMRTMRPVVWTNKEKKNDWSPKGSLSLIIPGRAGPLLCQAPERKAIHRFSPDPALLQARPLLRTMRPVVGTNKEKNNDWSPKGSLSLILPGRAGPLPLTGPRMAMPFGDHTGPRLIGNGEFSTLHLPARDCAHSKTL